MTSKRALRLYCKCGAAWVMSHLEARTLVRLLEQWERLHAGDGHGPTDARGAKRARELAARSDREHARAHGRAA